LLQNGKPTGAICHGPVALGSASLSPSWLYDGYAVTAFPTALDKLKELQWGDLLSFYPKDFLVGMAIIQ
jgi:putative intracellular protease/amidase